MQGRQAKIAQNNLSPYCSKLMLQWQLPRAIRKPSCRPQFCIVFLPVDCDDDGLFSHVAAILWSWIDPALSQLLRAARDDIHRAGRLYRRDGGEAVVGQLQRHGEKHVTHHA